jgi:hypothetical protein
MVLCWNSSMGYGLGFRMLPDASVLEQQLGIIKYFEI